MHRAGSRGCSALIYCAVRGAPAQDEDAEMIAAEMQDALGPLLEGVDEADVQVRALRLRVHLALRLISRASSALALVLRLQALCTQIARAFKGLGADGASAAGGADAVKEDHVVKCDNIILAYAGKSLLRSSSLRLVRGRRYGIVGQNGVGKTTLLTRIDAGNIFSKFLCIVTLHSIYTWALTFENLCQATLRTSPQTSRSSLCGTKFSPTTTRMCCRCALRVVDCGQGFVLRGAAVFL